MRKRMRPGGRNLQSLARRKVGQLTSQTGSLAREPHAHIAANTGPQLDDRLMHLGFEMLFKVISLAR